MCTTPCSSVQRYISALPSHLLPRPSRPPPPPKYSTPHRVLLHTFQIIRPLHHLGLTEPAQSSARWARRSASAPDATWLHAELSTPHRRYRRTLWTPIARAKARKSTWIHHIQTNIRFRLRRCPSIRVQASLQNHILCVVTDEPYDWDLVVLPSTTPCCSSAAVADDT